MPDNTICAQIMAKFDARMKTILTANGYVTNLGAHIYAWRATDFAESELPGMNYRDSENDRSNRRGFADQDNLLTIEMEVMPAPGSNTITDARSLIGDVYKAINVDDRWDNLADDTYPGPYKIEVDQKERIIGRITLSIIVEYTSEKWSF